MTKTYCDCCGKEIDFDYTRYNVYYDVKTVWHEPHQTSVDSDGFLVSTLAYYFHPGDVNVTLCKECGAKVVDVVKNTIQEIKKNSNKAEASVVVNSKVTISETNSNITIEGIDGIKGIDE